MRAIPVFTLFVAALGWNFACGSTTTTDGDKSSNDGGTGGTGGTSDGDAAPDTAAGATNGDSAGGSSGASTHTDAADSAVTDATTLPCNLPTATPDPDPTPAEQERAALARTFCENLAAHDCLPSDGVSGQAGLLRKSTQARLCRGKAGDAGDLGGYMKATRRKEVSLPALLHTQR